MEKYNIFWKLLPVTPSKYNGLSLLYYISEFISWVSTPENLSARFVNNNGVDQPVHPRTLISAFVIHLFKSIFKLATIRIFYLVSDVAEHAGFCIK